MKNVLLAGLMAATAFTPLSSAMAQQWQRDGTEQRGDRRANGQASDRDDRRDNRNDRSDNRGDRRDNRQEGRNERRDDRREQRMDRRDDRRDNRQDVRIERRDDRRDQRTEWRNDRRDNRQDGRLERRDDRRDWRETRQNDRRDNWRDNRRDDRRDWRQDNRRVQNRWADQRRWDNRWRDNRRYDWWGHRNTHRHIYRMPRYYSPSGWNYGYSRFSIGIYMGGPLYGRSYWISDPWYYRLPPAYGSLRWVRYYDDALLVDVRDGYVVDVIYDFFD